MMEEPVVSSLGTGLCAHSVARKRNKRVNKNNNITNKTGNVLNIEGRSCKYYCSGKAMSITQLECVCVCVCVFVDLGLQHATRMRHIVICGLPCSIKFFHITS